MVQFIKNIIILLIFIQPGYFQEKKIQQPSAVTGEHGQYPYWPYQLQTFRGNYNAIPRRIRKPCSRRMNSEDPKSESVNESEWIPTYTVATRLDQNNVLLKPRSLKDKDFISKLRATPNESIEIRTSTEKVIVENGAKKSVTNLNTACVTSTTTEEMPYRPASNDDQVGPNYDYYDKIEDKNEIIESESDYKSNESPENIGRNCNNKLESEGNSRRFLSPPVAFDDEQSVPVFNTNESVIKKDLPHQNNAIALNKTATNSIGDSQINERRSFHNLNFSISQTGGGIENKFAEPTKGRGISQMHDSKLMLMHNSKVCYACSSVSDPTCLKPDRRTTVKYCRVGHDSCVTKTIRNTNGLITIRDCARSCDDTDATGIMPHYKSCSICHFDLCNGAYAIKIYNIIFISTLIVLIKYLL